MNLSGVDEAADEESIMIVLLSFFLLNSYEASLGFEGVILVFLQKGYRQGRKSRVKVD
ncbi:hypothetical protein ACTSEZ_02885 [Metabacillus sp. JX24]|uniref:hypothetical protein n=1 Tax=Metabacillus sp. JX24 TaxID=3240759 RepID=UPI00350FC248